METKVLDFYNTVVGGLIALLSMVFGVYWQIFATFLIFNILDYITGWSKSRNNKTESSKKGLNGIKKKVSYWIIIAVAFLVGDIFTMMGQNILNVDLSFLHMIGWFTLACLMVNEARSILENLVEKGCNVPNFLIKGLAVTEKMLNSQTEIIDQEEKSE